MELVELTSITQSGTNLLHKTSHPSRSTCRDFVWRTIELKPYPRATVPIDLSGSRLQCQGRSSSGANLSSKCSGVKLSVWFCVRWVVRFYKLTPLIFFSSSSRSLRVCVLEKISRKHKTSGPDQRSWVVYPGVWNLVTTTLETSFTIQHRRLTIPTVCVMSRFSLIRPTPLVLLTLCRCAVQLNRSCAWRTSHTRQTILHFLPFYVNSADDLLPRHIHTRPPHVTSGWCMLYEML